MSPRSIPAIHFSKDAQDFLRLLHSRGVRYLLIGGEAVIYHGHPRYTGDVDFFYDPSMENCQALFEALNEFWGGRVPAVRDAQELTQPGMVFQFGRPPNRFDLLSHVDGIEFGPAWEQREEALMTGSSPEITLHILGLQDLISAKRAAGRPKDLDDLRYLEGSL